MADSLSDVMHTKLAAHYPTLGPATDLDTLIRQFAVDNPTFIPPLGTTTFYSATTTETLSDAAYRYWNAYVP